MARYIDADKLHIQMEDLYEHHIEMKNFSADGAVADCLDLLDNTPTADVEEVKHGEWSLHPDGSGTCNLCGRTQKSVWDFDNMQTYCGKCGAKMDGGKHNETN